MKREEELTVSVKTLAWEYHERPMLTYVASDDRGMMYHINQDFGSDSDYFATVRFDGSILYDGDDLSGAKAAAQSDYEARIRSALLPDPKPEATEGGAHEKAEPTIDKFVSAYCEARGYVLCAKEPAGYGMIDDDTGKMLAWTYDIEGTKWFNNYRASTHPLYRAALTAKQTDGRGE